MKPIFTLLVIFLSLVSKAQTIALVPFATGFSSPVDISHPVNDDRLFVVQQSGAIRILNPNGTINATNFLTLTTATIVTGSERGLLGLAFHPNYASNGYFYVNYTRTGNGATVIARYTVSANPNIADPSSATIILTIPQPYSNHNGGSLKFGPDGYLYIGMGDGGSGGDPENRAQNINENLGKMLRIDVDSASPYGIPPTNPYVGIAGNDEIWAIGLRNPWKFSFDRLNGDLWIGDVGQNQIEEINQVVAPTTPGVNFGWKCFEGNSVYSTCTGTTSFTYPVAQYTHSFGNCSITGGYVYRGSLYPNLVGKYIFADYCSNKIGLVGGNGVITWTTAFSGTNITTFGEDSSGEIYTAGSSNGVIYRTTDTSLAKSNFTKERFDIYPNPAQTTIQIKSNGLQFPASFSLIDTSGKVVLTEMLTTENQTISLTTFPAGFYLATVKDQTGMTVNSKLIVQ